MTKHTNQIDHIITADIAVGQAKERLQLAVSTAYDNGWTWHDIGTALGISRQAAQQRFSD